ncbi:helix-turn-helix domain-containing protein [Paenibacillus tarimensis]|uniref:helix-turn-helix domain-containing protein n=1 Tax=Paenibacillus tarimensis TaxID=416012 RepID=UPI001F2C50AB|nr:helix-turn-helix domain-containing protein [Paenibacillus tarimensis]MCF2944057.1 helix-turn-helix domain-containing protein [Paenibacillus tarimensis]
MSRISLFSKMILFGCAVSVLPLLALGYFSYQKSSASIQQQVNESNLQIMGQINGSTEQVLRTIDYTLNYVINTSQLQEALHRRLTYHDFQLYYNLKRELSLLQSPETHVTDVILANASKDWLINNRGLYTFSGYEHKETLAELMKLPESTSWVLLETGTIGSSDNESYGCSHTIVLVKKMPLLHLGEKRGAAFATIPSCQLGTMLGSRDDSIQTMVLDGGNRIVAHPQPSMIGKYLHETYVGENLDPALFTGLSGQFASNAGGRELSVTYVRSSFNGWVYASFTEMNEYTREARSIGWFTFYVSVLMVMLTVLFVWLGSRRVYTPIRQMFQAIAQRLPVHMENSRNELQVIDTHIKELFAFNTQLQEELDQTSRQVRTYFLLRLYQDQLGSTEIMERIRLYGYGKQVDSWQRLIVMTLQIDDLEDTRYSQKDQDLLLFAINNIVEEMIPPGDRLPPVIVDQTQVTLVGSAGRSEEEFGDDIYKLTEQIQQHMKHYLDLDVSIGISLPFESLLKAGRAYQEGLEALKHRLKFGKGVIIPYHTLNEGKHTGVCFYPKQLEHQLIDAIKLADEARAQELLKQWLDQVFSKERTPQEYQISLIRLLNDLLIVLQEAGIRWSQIGLQESSLYEELLQLYVYPEIESWFRARLIIPMADVFRQRQEAQYHNLSERIIAIIQNEYDTDLTLEKCASRLHYNPFYLSSVFKKETNLSFSEYLSRYRFNKAKQWLIETDMPIKEIAERLTYNNSQNFIRSFRKQENMTPGQYRKQYSSRES